MERTKVAINGLGRIGKHAVRILLNRFWDSIELVAINAPAFDAIQAAYIINYDSVYGYFEEFDVVGKDGIVYVNKLGEETTVKRIQLFDTLDASTLPWKELGIDVVIDCSGAYKKLEDAMAHISSGAKKMVISAPVKDPGIPTLVTEVNDDKLPENLILSNASCTTNCAATVLKVLSDHFTIESVGGVTVHAYTQSQVLLDKETKKGLREGRAAGLNIVPSTTGAAHAIELVLPELSGKVDMISMRVPVPSGSVLYLSVTVKENTTTEQVNELFKQASSVSMKDVLFYSEEELVSSDIVGTPYSSIVDGLSTEAKGNHIRVVAWYDNEWGYTNRLVEMALRIANN
jgi:glyceraldehyde 3-phosphate dehydrogenase